VCQVDNPAVEHTEPAKAEAGAWLADCCLVMPDGRLLVAGRCVQILVTQRQVMQQWLSGTFASPLVCWAAGCL